ncbi:MAG: carbohydrate binding family 9 domain-containing protein [Acidobacteriota bacterium]|nr:MAG: carbohydrate binding family 9 domain-containing protein [Acidobacteriota bacterium]
MSVRSGASLSLAVLSSVWIVASAHSTELAVDDENRLGAIPRLELPIEIDGVREEEAWQHAWSAELRYEINPGETTRAPVRTEVLVFHDASHFFAAFRAYDPEPRAIRAHLSDRDNAWADDWVGVVLDTFNDERRNYLLLVNPAGVQMDEIETWPSGSTVWDGIWDSAARITDWGWTAEIKVPFSSLRFQRSPGPQVWGFDAIRGYPRSVFRQMGAFPRDRNNNCYLCQAIKIRGFEGASPGKNIEIVPTLTSARTEIRTDIPDGSYDLTDDEAEFGVTARWGVTQNLTLAGTLNPDFSQIEADARQLDINEPFALFFPEKRPFFMEGADFFESSLDAVYTRTIRNPDWGAKLTGKEGAHTIGAYVVEDERTNILFPGSQSSTGTSLAMANTSAVLRYKRDIGSRYTFGGLATSREATDYHNRLAGLDGDFRFSEKDRVVVQVLGSSTRYPNDVATEFAQPTGAFNDWAFDLLYTRETRTMSYWAQAQDIGRDFRADLGFMPRVDIRRVETGADYLWTGDESDWYSKLLLIGMVAHAEDHEGNLLKREYAARFNYEGFLQSHAFIRPSRVREGFRDREYDLDELYVHFCLKPNGDSHAWINVIRGDRIDYVNAQPGERINLDGGFWYRAGRHLLVEPHFTYEKLDVGQGRLYEARIGQLTAAWQFTARTFLRAILQHVDYRYNVELYEDERDPESEQLFSQLLFSYKVNPQTVFFLGYSDNSIGNQDFALTRTDRTLFIKLGYAWVL